VNFLMAEFEKYAGDDKSMQMAELEAYMEKNGIDVGVAKDLFKILNRDGDDDLDLGEFAVLHMALEELRKDGLEGKFGDFFALYKTLDKDLDGKITAEEFKKLSKSEALFKLVNTDGDDGIEMHELAAFYSTYLDFKNGDKVSKIISDLKEKFGFIKEENKDIVDYMNDDHDDKIDLFEYTLLVKTLEAFADANKGNDKPSDKGDYETHLLRVNFLAAFLDMTKVEATKIVEKYALTNAGLTDLGFNRMTWMELGNYLKENVWHVGHVHTEDEHKHE